MLHPEGSSAFYTGLKVYGGSQCHEYLDARHSVLPFHDIFFLFWCPYTYNQHIGTTLVDDVNNMLTLLWLLVEAHAWRHCPDHYLPSYCVVDALKCQRGHVVERAQ